MHEALALADALMADSADAFSDDATTDAVKRFEALINNARKGEHTLHGKRVEAMFRFVAASLGQSLLIKEEDGGDVYCKDGEVIPPDYAIVIATGERILVEVKNHHKPHSEPWTIREKDLQSLERYAKLQGARLFFAIFWSRPRMWTLIPAEHLRAASLRGRRSIGFPRAMAINHMSQILGDMALATTPPLSFRLLGDFVEDASGTQPNTTETSRDRIGQFRVSAVELFCAGTRIDDELERTIAMYCMFYGSWRESDWHFIHTGEVFNAMELQFEPEERIEGQPFEMLGSLSALISHAYDDLTTKERKVRRLRARAPADKLGIAIPQDYTGKSLPLWRFSFKPNFDFAET